MLAFLRQAQIRRTYFVFRIWEQFRFLGKKNIERALAAVKIISLQQKRPKDHMTNMRGSNRLKFHHISGSVLDVTQNFYCLNFPLRHNHFSLPKTTKEMQWSISPSLSSEPMYPEVLGQCQPSAFVLFKANSVPSWSGIFRPAVKDLKQKEGNRKSWMFQLYNSLFDTCCIVQGCVYLTNGLTYRCNPWIEQNILQWIYLMLLVNS